MVKVDPNTKERHISALTSHECNSELTRWNMKKECVRQSWRARGNKEDTQISEFTNHKGNQRTYYLEHQTGLRPMVMVGPRKQGGDADQWMDKIHETAHSHNDVQTN